MTLSKIIKNKLLLYILYFTFFIAIIFFITDYSKKSVFIINLKSYYSDISAILNFPIISFFNVNLSLFSLVTFCFVIFLWFSIWKYYQKFIYWIKKNNENVSNGTVTILANIGYYIIISIVILSSLKLIWIDLSNITMIVSALSVWIWFWLQTIVSNFISGIILMFEQSIKVWDFIELWADLRWTVVSINMRSTTIRTNNNIDIIVPNQSFIENNIVNWTLWDNKIRLQIPFWVAYWTTYEKVQEVILWNLEKSDLKYIKDNEDMEPIIVMTWMGNSSVDFTLNLWVEWDNTNMPLTTKWVFLRLIYKSLNENNITIPFPQMDLHIKDSIPIEIKNIK
jgi:small-conductance mechanosensitive channel